MASTPEQRARHAANERRRLEKPGVREAKRARERERYAADAAYREKRRAWARGRYKPGAPPRKAPPEQRKARQRVADALRRGKMTKPTTCEGCGVDAAGHRLHAHHEDYGRPLEVSWLCVGCHNVLHRRFP